MSIPHSHDPQQRHPSQPRHGRYKQHSLSDACLLQLADDVVRLLQHQPRLVLLPAVTNRSSGWGDVASESAAAKRLPLLPVVTPHRIGPPSPGPISRARGRLACSASKHPKAHDTPAITHLARGPTAFNRARQRSSALNGSGANCARLWTHFRLESMASFFSSSSFCSAMIWHADTPHARQLHSKPTADSAANNARPS